MLVIDNREAKVLAHKYELSQVTYKNEQLTTGDYIIRHENNILAVIERKTLADYAASFKDGRADNKAKLLTLREKTGCRIMYIIEGPKSPSSSTKFGRIPYGHIKSSIIHLMMEYNIMIIQTNDALDTAKELVTLVRSIDTLLDRVGDSGFMRLERTPVGGDETTTAPSAEEFDMSYLTTPHVKSTHDIVREMWSCFAGITVETADSFIAEWSIADFVCEKVTKEVLREHKLTNRRKITSKTISALLTIGLQMQKKLLTKVPLISSRTADILFDKRNLRTIITAPVEIIASYETGAAGKKTKLGDKKAGKILELFYYTTSAKSPGPSTDRGQILGDCAGASNAGANDAGVNNTNTNDADASTDGNDIGNDVVSEAVVTDITKEPRRRQPVKKRTSLPEYGE